MKRLHLFFCASSLLVVACGSADAVGTAKTTSAALVVDASHDTQSAAEKWAEAKVLAEAKSARASGGDKQAHDPLAANDAIEESSIPKVELTPAKQLRGKRRGDLEAAVALVRTESSLEGAAKKLTMRLGKPSWTENGSRRIWVAPAGARCHRLVLDTDGSVELETTSTSEWRMLAATAKQNACTGEIKRGIEK